MSPSPYSNVIGELCHSLTVPLRSEQGEATERGVAMWEGCGTLDHTLRLPTAMLLQGTQVLQREGEVVNSSWWRKSSITTDFTRQLKQWKSYLIFNYHRGISSFCWLAESWAATRTKFVLQNCPSLYSVAAAPPPPRGSHVSWLWCIFTQLLVN